MRTAPYPYTPHTPYMHHGIGHGIAVHLAETALAWRYTAACWWYCSTYCTPLTPSCLPQPPPVGWWVQWQALSGSWGRAWALHDGGQPGMLVSAGGECWQGAPIQMCCCCTLLLLLLVHRHAYEHAPLSAPACALSNTMCMSMRHERGAQLPGALQHARMLPQAPPQARNLELPPSPKLTCVPQGGAGWLQRVIQARLTEFPRVKCEGD
jgi:hypothetical protein